MEIDDARQYSSLPDLPSVHDSTLAGLMTRKKTQEDILKMDITIHVCDEAKGVRQDFTCPRDLLLSEMKYFQDYLSPDTQKWEDVDISVHCDVKIFDWLIKYVKRNVQTDLEIPGLEESNVVSILISSDFLKMNDLVDQCIDFFFKHIDEILALPCNMNCINDQLVGRISSLFSLSALEEVKDKKDKFKSKLFTKKIQELFSTTPWSESSPMNASRLFRCIHCCKLLTPEFHQHIMCIASRTTIDKSGSLKYNHVMDSTWDVSDYILGLKVQLKSWRNVFWRLWATVNYLFCARCEQLFPCIEFEHCLHHPGAVNKADSVTSNIDVYSCCGHLAVPFDPACSTSGCSHQSHVVDVSLSVKNSMLSVAPFMNIPEVYAHLKKVSYFACVPAPKEPFRRGINLEGMLEMELVKKVKSVTISGKSHQDSHRKQGGRRDYGSQRKTSFQRINKTKMKSAPDEEDQEPDEPVVRVVINKNSSRKPVATSKGTGRTWDNALSVRLNQDLQREDDLKRMNKLLVSLKKNRSAENQDLRTNSEDNIHLPGGIYQKLEGTVRATILTSNSQISETGSSSNVHSGRRNKISCS